MDSFEDNIQRFWTLQWGRRAVNVYQNHKSKWWFKYRRRRMKHRVMEKIKEEMEEERENLPKIVVGWGKEP